MRGRSGARPYQEAFHSIDDGEQAEKAKLRASVATPRWVRVEAFGASDTSTARPLSSVRNPGGRVTKIYKDIATEAGIALH